jgi:thiamine biosynthesis lipoprotein
MAVRVLVPHRISAFRPPPEAQIQRLEGRSMGCGWSVLYADSGTARQADLRAGIIETLEKVVAQMSTWEPHSLISRFNRALPGDWIALPVEFAGVLQCALRVAQLSAGAFDPTVGAAVNAWGFGPEKRHDEAGFAVPDSAAIFRNRHQCGWQRVRVEGQWLLQPGDLSLDFSAIAKGFAVDAVSEFLARVGIDHHLVEAGGELRGSGVKADGEPWWVDVQPLRSAQDIVTRIALHDIAVATSGNEVQHYRFGSRDYSHCIDPLTGQPVDNEVTSVTVLHAQCMEADAWSTALMVLGPQDGIGLAERLGLAAQWSVTEAGRTREYASSHFRSLIACER